MKEYDFIRDITSYLLHDVSEYIIETLHISKKDIFQHGLSEEEKDKITFLVNKDVEITPPVGQYINELMYKVQLTQQELAVRTGFSKGYISNLINGRTNPPKYKLIRLAFALKLSVEETEKLLQTRGFTFTKSLKDKIIVACLDLELYDLIKVEEALNTVANANESLYD